MPYKVNDWALRVLSQKTHRLSSAQARELVLAPDDTRLLTQRTIHLGGAPPVAASPTSTPRARELLPYSGFGTTVDTLVAFDDLAISEP